MPQVSGQSNGQTDLFVTLLIGLSPWFFRSKASGAVQPFG
jgi:hypothetical protein